MRVPPSPHGVAPHRGARLLSLGVLLSALVASLLLIPLDPRPSRVFAEEESAPAPAKEGEGKAEAPAAADPDPVLGLKHLLETPYLPRMLDQEIFENLWRSWPEAQRKAAEAADEDKRRDLLYAHYGLTPRSAEDPRPLQFVVTDAGMWHMNCFACHGGQVGERVIPGAGNSQIALQSLVDDVAATRRILKRRPSLFDIGPRLPMGETVGTTNAVVFSIVLLQFRDVHLNVVPPRKRLHLPHHDLDAPAWWMYKHKDRLYSDGFATKNHRVLMQFLLVPTNGKKQVEAFADDFRHIQAYLEGIEAPAWPKALDAEQVARGRTVFKRSCAGCHGHYDGETVRYPNRVVAIDKLGTDPTRLRAIRPEDRATYAKSWFTDYDPSGVVTEPIGYIAPPLEGVWASPPYLHNGSVPTLYHLLFPEERPVAWRRKGAAYDYERGGLSIEAAAQVPDGLEGDAKRRWFDTTAPGKSRAGHDFPARLNRQQRMDLLAYLKSL